MTIIGYTDFPSRMATQASTLYGNNIRHMLSDLTPEKDGQLNHDMEDDVIRGATVTHAGEVTFPPPPPKVQAIAVQKKETPKELTPEEKKAAELAAGKVTAKDINPLKRRIRRLAKVTVHNPEHWILDNDLHDWLADSSGNAVLAQIIRRLRRTTQLFEIGRPFDRAPADAEEHLAILQALEDGNADAAAAAVLEHLRNIEADVLRIVAGG